MTIYTVVTGNYDNPRTPTVEGARFICFSDRPRQHSAWEIQPFPQLLKTARRNSRIPKMLPHLLFDDEFSVYIDGAFWWKFPVNLVLQLIGDADIAMFGHPGGHTSIHDERNFYQKLHGYVPDDVEAEYHKYLKEGIPIDGRFWAGGFVVRRHNERTAAFNEEWFRRYLEGSENDQFGLYAAVSTTGVNVRTIPGCVTMDHRFPYMLHADSKCGDNLHHELENSRWSLRMDRIKDLCHV